LKQSKLFFTLGAVKIVLHSRSSQLFSILGAVKVALHSWSSILFVNKRLFEVFNCNIAPKKRPNEQNNLLSFARTSKTQRRVLNELELKKCFALTTAFCEIYAAFCLVNKRLFELFNCNVAPKTRQNEKNNLLSFGRT